MGAGKQAFTCSRSQYRQEFPHYCVFCAPHTVSPPKLLPLQTEPGCRAPLAYLAGGTSEERVEGVLWCVNADVAQSVWRAGSHRTDCVASLTRTDPKGLFGTWVRHLWAGRGRTGPGWHVFWCDPRAGEALFTHAYRLRYPCERPPRRGGPAG